MTISRITEPNRPVRDFQERKYLRRDLSDQPADDSVGDRDFVNVAPLQLGKERGFVAHGSVTAGGV